VHRSRGIRLGEKYTKINIEKMKSGKSSIFSSKIAEHFADFLKQHLQI